MKAFAGHTEVQLEAIALDDVGWDRDDTRGQQEIVLQLAEPDLRAIGGYLHGRAQSCIAEEPGYFDDDDLRDVPVPSDGEFLVREPQMLDLYLRQWFWARDAILAVMERIDECIDAPCAVPRASTTPSYWIQDFRGVRERDGTLEVTLGVHAGPLYLDPWHAGAT